MPGPRAFGGRQAFRCRTHFSDANHIRMFSQHPFQQEILVNIQRRVFTWPRQKVDHRVEDIPIFIRFYQIELPAAFFYGNQPSIIRHLGQKPRHYRRLSRSGCSRDTDADTMPDARHKKVEHLRRRASGIQKFLLCHRLLVDNTDRHVDAHIRIHQRRFVRRNPDIFVQVSNHAWHGIIND